MYLHKEGCEYYRAIFNNIFLQSEKIISQEQRQNAEFNVSLIRQPGSYDVLSILHKLNEHTKNIRAHIKSEDNTIKNFIEKINKSIGKITDPKSAELFQVLQQLQSLEYNFERLEKYIENATDILSTTNNNEGRKLLNAYDSIRTTLKEVYGVSSRIAADLKKIIIEMQKEEELIKKEEQVLNDFNKNMMSWF